MNELRHYWSEETVQAAAPLIEDLDLEIKSVTYIKPNEDIPLKECVRRASSLSDELATCLYKAARQPLPGHKLRTDTADGAPDQESAFYILKYTYCAAVLTDNLLMDNREDCKFLLSAAGKRAIVGLHVRAICEYLKRFK